MAEVANLGILQFQQKIKGAVRPNLFQVSHSFPNGVNVGSGEEAVTTFCKSAALPASQVGTVELPFRGRVLKVPGDRTYESWTATFYLDDAFTLRSAYEKWIELTNAADANTASAQLTEIFQDVEVSQLDKFQGEDLQIIRTYKLVAAYPVSVSQISLAYDNNDSYEEFDVEFAYQFFETAGGTNSSNDIARVGG